VWFFTVPPGKCRDDTSIKLRKFPSFSFTFQITNRNRNKLKHIFRIKTYVIWGITLCSPLNFSRIFEGTFGLHLQGRRISQAGKRCEIGSKKNLLMDPEAGLDSPGKRKILAPTVTGLFLLRINIK
jgi:hypothetical protein